MRWPARDLEQVLVVLALFCYTGAISTLLTIGDASILVPDIEQSRAVLRLLWIPVYVVTLSLSLAHFRGLMGAIAVNPLLASLVLLTILSAAWSVAPEDTARRAAVLLVATLFGIYLGVRFRSGELMRLLAWAMGLIMALSYLFALLPPHLGIMGPPDEGAFRGVFTHRNLLGKYMLLNTMLLLLLAPATPGARRLKWADLALSIVLLGLTSSITSMLVGLALVGVLLLLRLWHARSVYFVPVLAGLLALTVIVGASADEILDVLGRDSTLTGRTELWAAVWGMIEQRPWLGYGYQAFWISPNGPAVAVWDALMWQAPSAHNGFLETWLGLGVVGLVLSTALFARTLVWAWRRLERVRDESTYWPLVFLLMLLGENTTESNFLDQNHLLWALFVATATHCYPALAAARQRASGMHGRAPTLGA
jgi:exopolysaccharide production protein ExoQ